jgi:transposase
MVSLTKKKVRGQTYWYLLECRRVNGKPRITWQKYLGTADRVLELVNRAERTGGPMEVDVEGFGPAPLLALAREMRIAETVDSLVPKREQGYSVGEHILIAAINRCIAPCSKLQIRRWFDDTMLPTVLGKKEGLSSQDYWNNFERLDDELLDGIQNAISRRAIERFGISLDFLYYDPTNFSTYIESHDDRGNTIPQRGKAKDCRTDLRLIGLTLLCSRDHGVPLLHRTYPGNGSDYPLFREEIGRIHGWLATLGRTAADVTLVFDKGNNSIKALKMLEESKLHYVGSLRPSYGRELLTVPLSSFRHCYGEGEEATVTYRLKRITYGRELTVVVTYNRQLERHLQSKLEDMLKSAASKVTAWVRQVNAGKRGRNSYLSDRPVSQARAKVRTLLGNMSKYYSWKVSRPAGGPLHVALRRREREIERRMQGFGRTIIFTDRHEWSDEEIVRAYRSKALIEDEFRRLKDTSYLSDTPQYHWTDSKIKCHQLICFIALQMMTILQRQLDRTGHHVTIDELAYALQHWYLVLQLYPGGVIERRLRPMSPVQEALHRELHLETYV